MPQKCLKKILKNGSNYSMWSPRSSFQIWQLCKKILATPNPQSGWSSSDTSFKESSMFIKLPYLSRNHLFFKILDFLQDWLQLIAGHENAMHILQSFTPFDSKNGWTSSMKWSFILLSISLQIVPKCKRSLLWKYYFAKDWKCSPASFFNIRKLKIIMKTQGRLTI